MSYSPGWSVIPQIIVRRERWQGGYDVRGYPLVTPGQTVLPDQPVLRIENVAQRESLVPDTIKNDTTFLNRSNHATIQTLPAGLYGRVVELTPRNGVVIEGTVALIQGVIGAGDQVAGVLHFWDGTSPSTTNSQPIPPGAILIVPGPLDFALLHRAAYSGVAGVVASSIALRDLEGFLRSDVLQLIDNDQMMQAQEHAIPLTLLFTEGLGVLPMPEHIIKLLLPYQGAIALLSGLTSPRHGISPELIISQLNADVDADWQVAKPDPMLTLGAQVRVCSGEQTGVVGIIDYFFVYEQIFASGIRARAVRLRLSDGCVCMVPLSLVERIG